MCRTIDVSDNLTVVISNGTLNVCRNDGAVLLHLRRDEIIPLVAALRDATTDLLAQEIAQDALLAALTETARMLEEKPIR